MGGPDEEDAPRKEGGDPRATARPGVIRGIVRALLGPRRIRQEVDEEIRFHLEMRERELTGAGLAEGDARAEALRLFGDVEETRASCARSDRRRELRAERREVVQEAWRDARLALRQLAKRPRFAVAATLTLAIGIGASTAIFSAADHVLFRPLPHRDVGRVVTLWETDEALGTREDVAAGNFLEWKARSRAFEALALAEPFGFALSDVVPPEPVEAWLVTEEWLEAVGVEPALGRGFAPEEFADEGPFVVVLPHALWTERYGADPGVVGSEIELDRTVATVVGVLPPGLVYPSPRALWAPKRFRVTEAFDERSERVAGYMKVVGRLAADFDLRRAREDMVRVAATLAADFPESNAGRSVAVVPLRDHLLGDVRPALLVLLAAVALVLLIACANVASLILSRAGEREREVSVRSALGAGRSRIARQLLTESLVLALAGGGAGVALAALGVRVFARVAPADLPLLEQVGIDARVLAFALALTLGTTVLFGLAPALRLSASARNRPVADGTRSRTGAPRHSMQRALVVAEVALALVLLAGAGLLGRSFLSLVSNDLGFVAERRAAVQLFLWDLYPTAEEREVVVGTLRERMRALPGVSDVVVASALPFHPHQIDPEDVLLVEGRPVPEGERTGSVFTLVASPGYFRVLGIPLLRGREFEEGDRFDAPRVAVVNESLARRHFPGEDPIGRRVTIGVMSRPEVREIVGVVADVRPTGVDADPRPELYIPWEQSRTGSVTFVAATAGPPERVVPALRAEVGRVDPRQTVYHAATLEEMIADTLRARRLQLLLLGGLSLVALVLAAVGVYGLVGYVTSQRAPEIGLRMALGAGRREVVWMVVGDGLRLALAGVALGLAGALALARFVEGLLYGPVAATDPATLVQVALLMLGVALAAAYLPARRAASLDPADVLRAQ